MTNQNSWPSPKELSGDTSPIRNMFLEFCKVAELDAENPYSAYIFFSSAMALYNTMMVVMRSGDPQHLADFTKHVRDDLNLYFMPKDSTIEH